MLILLGLSLYLVMTFCFCKLTGDLSQPGYTTSCPIVTICLPATRKKVELPINMAICAMSTATMCRMNLRERTAMLQCGRWSSEVPLDGAYGGPDSRLHLCGRAFRTMVVTEFPVRLSSLIRDRSRQSCLQSKPLYQYLRLFSDCSFRRWS